MTDTDARTDLIERLRSGATRCEHLDEMLQADDPCRWGGAETLFWATDMRAAADLIAALLAELDAAEATRAHLYGRIAGYIAELDARTDPDLAARLLPHARAIEDTAQKMPNMGLEGYAADLRAAARLLGGNPPTQTPAPILRHGVFVRENSGLWESYIDGNYIADHASESEAWAALGVDPPPTPRLLGGAT